MTIDPTARELFIAHGPTVQVVDVDSGTVVGTVRGFQQAHAVVLGRDGTQGYATDGQAALVRIFDRRSFKVVANIPTGPAPRSMVFESSSGLLFVIGAQPSSREEPKRARTGAAARIANATPHGAESSVTVIDVEHRAALAELVIPGDLGFAQSDGDGRVYVTVRDRNQIIRLDAQAIGNVLHRILGASAKTMPLPNPVNATAGTPRIPVLNWFSDGAKTPPVEALPYALNLGSICEGPRALAIDANHSRLFAACSNFRMVVLDPQTGGIISALPIGPGPDAIVYDANRGLIFTANGAGDGSVTIIRQDVTDTYSVTQTLPTRQHARTLAIDPSSGNVYLTSIISGAGMNTPMTNGRPAPLKVSPIDSSFQVLVVGN